MGANVRYPFLFLCLFILVKDGLSVMSDKQLAATKRLIRNTCTNKSGVPPEKVDGIYKGDFDFSDKTVMMKKDNTFDWEEGIKVIGANAPPSLAATAVPSFKNCKNCVKSKDQKCKAALEIAKCLYEDDPANYFLP